MSAEAVYVQSIVAAIRTTSNERLTANVTDIEDIRDSGMNCAHEGARQGPLAAGEFMDVGAFGSESPPVAPRREFTPCSREDEQDLIPATVRTRRIRSWLARRRLERYLSRDL